VTGDVADRRRFSRFRLALLNVYAGGCMADTKRQQTEKTPKGLEVPVPKRDTFFANLKKVAKVPRKGSAPRGAQK